MRAIAMPSLPVDHPDHGLEAAEAADAAFHELLHEMENAGWDKAECAAAMLHLAQHRVRELEERGYKINFLS